MERKTKAVQINEKLTIPSYKSPPTNIPINNGSVHWYFLLHCLTVTGKAEFLFLIDFHAEWNLTAGAFTTIMQINQQ